MANSPKLIPLSEHPSNLDRSAELVSGAREAISIFRVKGGFVGVTARGLASRDLFSTKDIARTSAERVA